MRFLSATALVLALGAGLACTAHALDVEVVAPPEAAVVATQPQASSAVETGSIDQVHAVPDSATEPAPAATPGEPGIGRGIRDILEAEAAAVQAAAPASVPEGTPKPAKPPEERDRDALQAFYESRGDAPIWVSKTGLNAKALAAIAEIKRAGDWGLEAGDFELPTLKAETGSGADPARNDLVKAEMTLSLAVMKYHRYARGGAIYDAPKTLSSFLDRRPQIRDRKTFLEQIAAADDVAKLLVDSHPQQPEFKRLLAAWREASAGPNSRGKPGKANADALLANMQQWRWLPEDLGNFYVWVNVPEYLIRIVKDGEVIWTERITAGLVNKQTPIFSDEMERVTFKSKWRVPDSIKVKEVWPSLLRGGGLMRQHGLVMMRGETDEQVDWRKIDWSKADMNDYVLWQPPGPKNLLGVVKFSFPSKHRVFMHDTPDKYMFAWTRRANSHGCMRIRNPLQMAAIILGRDKGWDRAKIDDLVKNGPTHNVVELDQKIPVHITYFTTRIDETGKVQTFSDIYGHEKKVRLALAGQWTKIANGARSSGAAGSVHDPPRRRQHGEQGPRVAPAALADRADVWELSVATAS